MSFGQSDIQRIAAELEPRSPQEVLAWAFETFGNEVALACSFGVEDVALVDMMVKQDPRARVFCLDTGRLHQATYNVLDQVRAKYGIAIETYFPQRDSVENLVRLKGPNSFYESIENRKECCHIRKVEPLSRALSGLRAWVTGLRRDQAVTRVSVPKVELDSAHGNMAKVNPLAAWSQAEVWAYVREHNVPYNKLHDEGFPSIGCEPCTRAVKPGEDPRAGRWWWELPEHKECGLHVKPA
jgi:phosphoadenosine phosphosulfate reductase